MSSRKGAKKKFITKKYLNRAIGFWKFSWSQVLTWMEKKFWASWPGMTHFLGNDLEDIEYLIHILIKLNKSIKSPKKNLQWCSPLSACSPVHTTRPGFVSAGNEGQGKKRYYFIHRLHKTNQNKIWKQKPFNKILTFCKYLKIRFWYTESRKFNV